MSNDLIERLRFCNEPNIFCASVAGKTASYGEAADALETQAAELHTLRAERDAAVQAAELRGVALGIEAAAKWAKDDAKTCDCDAHSESECACGAWCEWKTVPMHRVIEALSALSPAAIIAAQGGE